MITLLFPIWRNAALLGKCEGTDSSSVAFPIGFTWGSGLKRKCMTWLEERQSLPYTSPYVDASHLDPRTDVSEKRLVRVFHELLQRTIYKQTENTKMKSDTQTVVLRDAFCGSQLIEKYPLEEVRRRYAYMMVQGFLDRIRDLYREDRDSELVKKRGFWM